MTRHELGFTKNGCEEHDYLMGDGHCNCRKPANLIEPPPTAREQLERIGMHNIRLTKRTREARLSTFDFLITQGYSEDQSFTAAQQILHVG